MGFDLENYAPEESTNNSVSAVVVTSVITHPVIGSETNDRRRLCCYTAESLSDNKSGEEVEQHRWPWCAGNQLGHCGQSSSDQTVDGGLNPSPNLSAQGGLRIPAVRPNSSAVDAPGPAELLFIIFKEEISTVTVSV